MLRCALVFGLVAVSHCQVGDVDVCETQDITIPACHKDEILDPLDNAKFDEDLYSLKRVAESVDGCTAGWSRVKRPNKDSNSGWVMVAKTQFFRCSGKITSWKYRAKSSNPLRAIVFRAVKGSKNRYRIVGVNDIPAGKINREVTFPVKEEDQIYVKMGDVIGWASNKGVLAYEATGNEVRWIRGDDCKPNNLEDDQQLTFASSGKRRYSISATVKYADQCRRGFAIKAYPKIDSQGWTMVAPKKSFDCDGKLTQWNYRGKASHPFRAIVFRRVGKSATRYQIVGINDIPAGKINKRVVYKVPDDKQISVKAGDMIGWSFGNAVLAWDAKGKSDVQWIGGHLMKTLGVDRVVNIKSGIQPRQYAISANLKRDKTKMYNLAIATSPADECTTGFQMMSKGGVDSSGWTMVSPDKKFLCAGKLSSWTYNAKHCRTFRAIVFRPVNNKRYKIVGINDIPGGPTNEEYTYEVPEEEQISVRIGDVIGWSFGRSSILYKSGKRANSATVQWVGGNLHSKLKPKQIKKINGGSEQRQYAISASVIQADQCRAGWPLKDRQHVDGGGYTMVASEKVLSCDGKLTKWRFVAKKSSNFQAIVFRPADDSGKKYDIVGINNIPEGKVGQTIVYKVPENEQISVEPGDVIGWSYGSKAVIAYNTGGGFRVRWRGGNLMSSLKVSKQVKFGGKGNREYSIEAEVRRQGKSCDQLNTRLRKILAKVDTSEDACKRRECYAKADGSDYLGRVSVTENGIRCQSWKASKPHRPFWKYRASEEDVTHPRLYKDHNYCRVLPFKEDRDTVHEKTHFSGRDRPWCYTMKKKHRWQYCDVGKPNPAGCNL